VPKFDFHTHSYCSDGVLSPRELVARAAAHGVTHLALTDHDELAGLGEARRAAKELGITLVSGVEISTEYAGTSVHVVGLAIDPEEARLVARLDQVRAWRLARAEEIARGLAAAGIAGALDGARHYARNPELISRTHFARYLVDAGYCASKGEVFARYMKPGKPGYVPQRWLPLGEAVALIVGAGGIAVLAHPARYEFDAPTLEGLLDEFAAAGGEAIEVVCGGHAPEEWARFGAIARRRGLLASIGSDFHAPDEGRVDLGQLPGLPASLPSVMQRLLHHA